MNPRRFYTPNVMPASEGMTDKERHADAMLLFENFERYVAQSAATLTEPDAPLPPRRRLLAFLPKDPE